MTVMTGTTGRHRSSLLTAVLTLLFVFLGTASAQASAGPRALAAVAAPAAPAAPAAEGTAWVRAVHLVPGLGTMVISLVPFAGAGGGAASGPGVPPATVRDGALVVEPAAVYGQASDYRQVPAGLYAVQVRPYGADPNTQPVLSGTVETQPDHAYTLAAVGSPGDSQIVAFPDDLRVPPSGSAKVRLLAAAPATPPLDVTVDGGRAIAVGARFGRPTDYATVPAGTWRLTITPSTATSAGRSPLAGDLPVRVVGGNVYTVLVLGTAGGGLTARPLLDASGMARTPVHGVQTGGGGTASEGVPGGAAAGGAARGGGWGVVAAALVGLVVLGAAGRFGTRRADARVLRARPVTVVLLAGLFAGGVVAGSSAVGRAVGRATPEGALPPAGAGTGRAAGPGAAVELSADAPPVPLGRSRPVELVIPSIGVRTGLVDLGIEADGTLQAPADFGLAGWLRSGPAPGESGPAVIAGHVDSRTGPAVFSRLHELVPGAQVQVRRQDGSTAWFVVRALRSFPKDRFPTDTVYGPAPGPVLRLITCDGTFDTRTGHYRDNLVVFAS